MRRIACTLALGLSWMSLAGAQDDLPSAESILDRYVEVTGGQDAYENLTSAVAEGTMEIVAAGITGQIQVSITKGQYHSLIELPGVGTIESGVTDGVAWENSVITGPRIMQGSEADLTVLGADPAAAAHWRDLYTEVETIGVEEIAGESAYRLSLATESGFEITCYYSVDSGLLLRQDIVVSTQGLEVPMRQSFEDYSEDGGIVSAGRIVIDQGVTQIYLTFTAGEYNVDIPAERFELPEAVQALLQ